MLLTKKNDQKKMYMIIYIIIKNILCMVQYRRRDSVFLASHVYVKKKKRISALHDMIQPKWYHQPGTIVLSSRHFDYNLRFRQN